MRKKRLLNVSTCARAKRLDKTINLIILMASLLRRLELRYEEYQVFWDVPKHCYWPCHSPASYIRSAQSDPPWWTFSFVPPWQLKFPATHWLSVDKPMGAKITNCRTFFKWDLCHRWQGSLTLMHIDEYSTGFMRWESGVWRLVLKTVDCC